MSGRGVVTNGIGKRTTAHLNLTRSLADADASLPKPLLAPARRGRPAGPVEKRRIPFAGRDS